MQHFFYDLDMEVNLRNTLTGHQNPIYTVAIDPVQHKLYSAGNDKGIVEWDLTNDTFSRVLCNVSSSVYCLCIIPQSNYLVAGLRNGDVLVIDRGLEVVLKAQLSVGRGAVFTLQYLPLKNELLAIGEDGRAFVWSLETFDLLYQFQVSKTTVRSIAWDSASNTIAFGDKNGVVYLYDAYDYRLIHQASVHQGGVSSLEFVDGVLLSGGRDANLYKLSIPTLKILSTVVPHMFTVYGIQAIGNRMFSTVSRDKTIKIWNLDLKLQKNISRDKGIESHFLSINTQAFHTNQAVIATAGDDKTIKIWQLS